MSCGVYVREKTNCPYKYIRDNGITLERYEFSEIEGSCMWLGDNAYIGVIKGLDPIKEREVLAHEIGHLQDHTDKIIGVRYAEYRADQIGREFLIPYDDLVNAIEEEEGICDAYSLAQRFGVSVDCMIKRVKEVFNHQSHV